jgi:hypothetical protein
MLEYERWPNIKKKTNHNWIRVEVTIAIFHRLLLEVFVKLVGILYLLEIFTELGGILHLLEVFIFNRKLV